jgi:hypothetical protein
MPFSPLRALAFALHVSFPWGFSFLHFLSQAEIFRIRLLELALSFAEDFEDQMDSLALSFSRLLITTDEDWVLPPFDE